MKFINQYNVELTDECKKDIRNIYTYIRNNLDAEDAANRLIDKFEFAIRNLEYFSKIYAVIDKYENIRRIYRRIVVNNYIILFTIDEKDKKVYVSHIYSPSSRSILMPITLRSSSSLSRSIPKSRFMSSLRYMISCIMVDISYAIMRHSASVLRPA